MCKKILAGLLAALCLCSCGNSISNQHGTQNATISSEAYKTSSATESSSNTEIQKSTAFGPTIRWGDVADVLKQFDDHNGGKNNYRDYFMTIQLELNGKLSKALPLSGINLGPEFLTELQKRDPVPECPQLPADEAKITLAVTDAGVTYWYLLYENGMVFTEQNGKAYYLGSTYLTEHLFAAQLSVFIRAALNTVTAEQAGAPELPPLDLNGAPIGDGSAHKTDFKPEEYDIAIVEVEKGTLSTPVLIRDAANKAKILDYLNKKPTWSTNKPREERDGPVIRLFNQTECFNYCYLRFDDILDYQNGEANRAPYDLSECLQMSVAYELVCILEDKETIDSGNEFFENLNDAFGPDVQWGEYADPLKQYADHDGRKNNYDDYIMTIQLEINGKVSKALSLADIPVGSDFLTELQQRDPVKERPLPPKGRTKVTLTVTDAGVTCRYILYEGGRMYTVQHGKVYYLGKSSWTRVEFRDKLNIFRVAALEAATAKQGGAPKLPAFDPNSETSSNGEASSVVHKTDFTPEEYDIVILLRDAGYLSVPILVKDIKAKEKIINYLNKTTQVTKKELLMGDGGLDIRVFNQSGCFNYEVAGDRLDDYQNGERYTAPDGLSDCIDEALINELVRILEDK
ncbi:hypothetical protein [Acetanaerobacterium elongatum]|uniref:Uncharacterized protein n=1 Tax=Acetanaerobacterium elongatum TaxID=258515 RepID=A0A1H0GER1_9FIRM|nr:hypothetical protein [Acetanaerobacterium elongatum]SDO05360.1 hypothetical protein SAMN05192585_1508 [Acetanaerobacterium elongatum]